MTVTAIDHAMAILERLADEPAGVSVTDLSQYVGVNKGSIARVLISLQGTGHVVQDAVTERYYLSLKTVSIAQRYMDRLGFPALIQPLLNKLSAETGELAQLSACDRGRLYVIAKAEGENRIRIESLLGREIALHASATGKAWLSGMPREEAIRILSHSPREKLTPNTVTDFAEIERELDETRQRGYALQREELMDHMSAVALPVRRNAEKIPVGALVIAAPTFRFPETRIPEFRELLQQAAERIGELWPPGNVHVPLGYAGAIAKPDYSTV
jgi:IclR family transcriptional regulator, acetate operon repressor